MGQVNRRANAVEIAPTVSRRRYRCNAQNQLVEVNVAGVVTRYTYDALGRRISKTTEPGAQQSTISTTTFYWNGDVLLGEINEGVSSTSRTYLFEPFGFKPLALVQHGQVYHYHTDHIGTPREITNARAEVVWSGTFKTYGALALAHVNEVDNPLRFQGQYYDEETGLHYNRHRYFDPKCGQFTTQDPIGLLGGMNAYQYAPNPMTWVDPWGLLCKEGSDRVKRNVDESRRARESSRFNEYSDREWPPNRGFESTPEPKVLMPGERIDRYGSPYGTYTSPEGTPYRARAPKPGTDLKPYSVYEVTQPIEVRSGSAKPWFGYEGGGMQYEMSQSMKDLEAAGKIKRVN
ncbi:MULTISPECIES: glycohydrolase toxin TNT-related protein [unclassified Limnobacter]|uniref:RHS repeat-associated core domain-containing protein n=1 Tax=unclassified Limnobacter TaxID=2630203 RepID=UPI0025C6870B|nr:MULTISPECIES: glycohydrolase toxin TNT-related protein [unclassified Limnobacter]